MTRLIYDVDINSLRELASDQVIPVLLYGPHADIKNAGIVGNDLRDKFARLSLPPSVRAVDLVTVAMAITAADTFVLREDSADGWRREIELELPVVDVDLWSAISPMLQRILGFLSGDAWSFTFRSGGFRPPTRLDVRARLAYVDPSRSDCVALFSGGLDSALGVRELLGQGRRPLLVSHASTGDKSYQHRVATFLEGTPQRLEFNSYPSWPLATEISTRTRSFQFLAVGALAADVLHSFRGGSEIELNICENGLIALNPPLTRRRLGALSTRTAHPHYLSMMQDLLNALGLNVRITNPHAHETKGEMLHRQAKSQDIEAFAAATVSCGNWKRKGEQCGRCWPCLIRRASFHSSGVADSTGYQTDRLTDALRSEDLRDDIVSVHTALFRRYQEQLPSWVLKAGPLPGDESVRQAYYSVVERGMDELEAFFTDQGLRL